MRRGRLARAFGAPFAWAALAFAAASALGGCGPPTRLIPFRSHAELARYVEEAIARRERAEPPAHVPPPTCLAEHRASPALATTGSFIVALWDARMYSISRATLEPISALEIPRYARAWLYAHGRSIVALSWNVSDGSLRDPGGRIASFEVDREGRLERRATTDLSASPRSARFVDGRLFVSIDVSIAEAGAGWDSLLEPTSIVHDGSLPREPALQAVIACDEFGQQPRCVGRGVVIDSEREPTHWLSERALYITTRAVDGRRRVYRVPFDRSAEVGAIEMEDATLGDGEVAEDDEEVVFTFTGSDGLVRMRLPVASFTSSPTPVSFAEHAELVLQLRGHASPGVHGRYIVVRGSPPFPAELARSGDPAALSDDHPLLALHDEPFPFVGILSSGRVRVFDAAFTPGSELGRGWRASSSARAFARLFRMSGPPSWPPMASMPAVVLAGEKTHAAMMFVGLTPGEPREIAFFQSAAGRELDEWCAHARYPAPPVFDGDRAYLLLDGEVVEIRVGADGHAAEVRRARLGSSG